MGERIVGRWWNGKWGRMSRKDIWIVESGDGTVLLRWAHGGREYQREADDLDCARDAAEWLREHGDDYDRWVDWIDLYVKGEHL